ncbi:MAG: Holliday junction branch migration protein RuvA [Flavobacteriales bacterium]|nr:Holliday junction branch migration protein RuvA [Flavobacteriales bacterium]
MISILRGNIIEINPNSLIIDCNGIGYEVYVSLETYSQFQDKKEIQLFTKLIVREDAHILYGFYSKTEREVFNLLISVNGVGPSSAIVMLSTLSVEEIATAITNGNNSLLQKVKGIGLKTAQRIIIDLKDKMFTFADSNGSLISNDNKNKIEALNALEVLGIPPRIAEKHINAIIKDNPSSNIEEIIKTVLKRL